MLPRSTMLACPFNDENPTPPPTRHATARLARQKAWSLAQEPPPPTARFTREDETRCHACCGLHPRPFFCPPIGPVELGLGACPVTVRDVPRAATVTGAPGPRMIIALCLGFEQGLGGRTRAFIVDDGPMLTMLISSDRIESAPIGIDDGLAFAGGELELPHGVSRTLFRLEHPRARGYTKDMTRRGSG